MRFKLKLKLELGLILNIVLRLLLLLLRLDFTIKMGILQNYVQVFRLAKPYSLYVLFVLLIIYILNQLHRYSLSVTSLEIAQSLKFGDQACMKLANASEKQGSVCSNLTETM
jgi:hypothetical protein